MRLLHLIGSMDPLTGGPCQGIRNSSPVLEQLGVYREVVCFDDVDAAYLGMDSFPVHALGKGRSAWQYNANLIPWLRENLNRFDVVISNGLWLFHTYAVCLAMKELKHEREALRKANMPYLKWFIVTHGMLDPYFQQASSRKIKAIRNWFYWLLIENKVVDQADGLLFTCETELLLARKTFTSYMPKREVDVGYGIEAPPAYNEDIHKAFLEKCPGLVDVPYILFLSRIHPKKGVDLLIKAYILVRDQWVDIQRPMPKLVIAGPGIETEYGRKLMNLINNYPIIKSNIYFPGMLTGDAKWGALYGCEAFILPSHQENFGIAVAEALACSKPVLISNQVNIWREIEAGRGGLVADNSLAGTIKNLCHWIKLSSSEKQTIGERARATYQQYFTIEIAAKKFFQAINSTDKS